METQTIKPRISNFSLRIVMVCTLLLSFSLIHLQARSIDSTGDKKFPILKANQSSAKLFTQSETQIEEDLEVEHWMLHPKHSSWLRNGEDGIELARWMVELRSGNWLNYSIKEPTEKLQNWMLSPRGWLQ